MTTKIYCDKCGKELNEKEYYIKTGIGRVYTYASNDTLEISSPEQNEAYKKERQVFKEKWDFLTEKDFCYECISVMKQPENEK